MIFRTPTVALRDIYGNPVSVATEQTLDAILTALGLTASETTQQSIVTLLTNLVAKDFATEAKLEAVRVLIASINTKDFATETTLEEVALLLDSINDKIPAGGLATEITLTKFARGDVRYQKRYDIQSDVIYTGFAPNALATNATGWTIKRVQLDVSGNPTAEQWTGDGSAVWDNRATETYT